MAAVRLEQDGKQHDYIWYASVYQFFSNDGKDVDFEMFNPTDWKRYTAHYCSSTGILRFCDDSIGEMLNTVDLTLKMINFVKSDELKNVVIEEDPSVDYIWKI